MSMPSPVPSPIGYVVKKPWRMRLCTSVGVPGCQLSRPKHCQAQRKFSPTALGLSQWEALHRILRHCRSNWSRSVREAILAPDARQALSKLTRDLNAVLDLVTVGLEGSCRSFAENRGARNNPSQIIFFPTPLGQRLRHREHRQESLRDG